MDIHYEFPDFRIVKNFRSLQHSNRLLKYLSAVPPMRQIDRCITTDAPPIFRVVPCPVFTKPIKGVALLNDPTTMRLNGLASRHVPIQPNSSGPYDYPGVKDEARQTGSNRICEKFHFPKNCALHLDAFTGNSLVSQ